MPDWQYNRGPRTDSNDGDATQSQQLPPFFCFPAISSVQGVIPPNSPVPAGQSVCQRQAPSFRILPASACLSINAHLYQPARTDTRRPTILPTHHAPRDRAGGVRAHNAPLCKRTSRPAGPFNGELTMYLGGRQRRRSTAARPALLRRRPAPPCRAARPAAGRAPAAGGGLVW